MSTAIIDVATPHGLDEAAFAAALARIAELAPGHDAAGRFPAAAFELLRPTGVLALTVPVELGGLGKGIAEAVEVIERIGAADPSVGLILQWNYVNHLALRHPDNPWPRALAEQVLRSAATDGTLINGVNVERELGSLSRGGLPATTATRLASGDWRIDGEKAYATGISGLSWFTVTASTAEPEPKIATFLLDRSARDWEVLPTWNHLGLRASDTQSVLFSGTVVPHARLVDLRDPKGRPLPRPGRQALPLLLAANYNGVAIATRDWLVRYLHTRVPTALGAPLATVPRFHDRVGEIEAAIQTSRALLRQGVAALVAGERSPLFGLAKHVATATAIRVTESALDLTGNPGLDRRNPLERHHRDAMVGRIHTPQSDAVLAQLGRDAIALGRPEELS
ncbi:acyl-CoA dehydrogenase family protein [Nocardia asteroides]|uniref:acyl-CoA dehydrogenase family protein n=1 Tax=Nocardia asteroides TaxID=1824 RepID=UPI001E623CB2|nr:acyl-CoA dehydrogenase family protein [Nocardia asteroides]UGT63149.1 acyl-CoA/acyl-ACP dehydrogenase [Nocardia asteroides]